jgi:hypothetical protein
MVIATSALAPATLAPRSVRHITTASHCFSSTITTFGQNLTLNYDLRREYFGPISEKHGLLYNFGADTGPDGMLEHVGSGGLSGAYTKDWTGFQPRIGVAWTPLTHTTLRAAYGIYDDYIPQHLMIANYTPTAFPEP